eukprot:gene14930-10971_t
MHIDAELLARIVDSASTSLLDVMARTGALRPPPAAADEPDDDFAPPSSRKGKVGLAPDSELWELSECPGRALW